MGWDGTGSSGLICSGYRRGAVHSENLLAFSALPGGIDVHERVGLLAVLDYRSIIMLWGVLRT